MWIFYQRRDMKGSWASAELMSTHEQGDAKESRLGLGAVDQGPAVAPVGPLSLSFQLNLSKLSHRAKSEVSECDLEQQGRLLNWERSC